MWGHDKLKDWVCSKFATNGDMQRIDDRYWELWHKLNALYHHLGLEYREVPGHHEVIKKDRSCR